MEVRLYHRPVCHLCDILQGQVEALPDELRGRIELVHVDITTDPVLEEAYGLRIPVLEAQGEVVAQGRIASDLLERRLRRRLQDV